MRNPFARGPRALIACLALVLPAVTPVPAQAQKKYDTGASDTEIRIGNFVPYSGPVSAYGTIGKTHAAYFAKINAEGGINGRKITYLSADDAYNPAPARGARGDEQLGHLALVHVAMHGLVVRGAQRAEHQ
uniref:ABC transporter substrate-binding protein n=1 Tax=Delftia acidovorans TaxID=80866 RepID=UPI0035A090B4